MRTAPETAIGAHPARWPASTARRPNITAKMSGMMNTRPAGTSATASAQCGGVSALIPAADAEHGHNALLPCSSKAQHAVRDELL